MRSLYAFCSSSQHSIGIQCFCVSFSGAPILRYFFVSLWFSMQKGERKKNWKQKIRKCSFQHKCSSSPSHQHQITMFESGAPKNDIHRKCVALQRTATASAYELHFLWRTIHFLAIFFAVDVVVFSGVLCKTKIRAQFPLVLGERKTCTKAC